MGAGAVSEGLPSCLVSFASLLHAYMDSSAPPPPPNPTGEAPKPEATPAAAAGAASSDDVKMEEAAVPEEEPLPDDILNASPEDIMTRVRLIDNDLKVSSSAPANDQGLVTLSFSPSWSN